MNFSFRHRTSFSAIISIALMASVFVAPLRAQQTAPQLNPPQATDPTFDTLLSGDSYKIYVEIRNVGQLLTTGGAGDIVEPIIKLASPGPEFKSLLKFLKDNSEQLATSRLMLAMAPARKDIPSTMAALEFATPEEAAKFAPKLETFLPTVIPPVPDYDEQVNGASDTSRGSAGAAQATAGASVPRASIQSQTT